MDSFNDWFNRTWATVGEVDEPDVPECLLEDGIENKDAEGGWEYRCVKCNEYSPIYCEPSEFDPNYHYCGRSPHCCP
jgi:hypothetical protein